MIIGQSARSKLLWVTGTLLVILLVYLALGVFGVQTLLYDTEVNEDFALGPPASEEQRSPHATNPAIVSSGKFHAVAHEGTGDAIVYRLENGSHVLRLENLDIFNGPALYVYAVAAEDASDSETVQHADSLNLGPLKGNRGNQTYELPADFDPERYRSISIWCKRFSVNFATAPLR
jgi:electron transfer DM13